jgi:hypothetical protein
VMSAVLGRLGRCRSHRAILITLTRPDNPAKLKEYPANFDRRLIGATGSEEAVTRWRRHRRCAIPAATAPRKPQLSTNR